MNRPLPDRLRHGRGEDVAGGIAAHHYQRVYRNLEVLQHAGEQRLRERPAGQTD